MLQPDAVARLRLMAETAALPAAAATDRVQQLDALRPGERITAHITRELANGSFHVTIRGRTYEMQLPPGARRGDALKLAFIHDRPRPTFFLLDARGAEQGDRLSQIGRLISVLVRERGSEERSALRAPNPVLPEAPGDTLQAAPRLRAALAQSGLFYESHQAQWVAGHRSLEQLKREPQARIAATAREALPAAGKHPDAAAPQSTAENAPIAADLRGGPVHPEAYPIVRQQLETLESRHALWMGEIWPGQLVEWETGEAPDEAGSDGQAAWFTTLLLELPALGALRARAVLAADGVRLTLDCADAGVAERLRASATVLASGLEGQGLRLVHIDVKTHVNE